MVASVALAVNYMPTVDFAACHYSYPTNYGKSCVWDAPNDDECANESCKDAPKGRCGGVLYTNIDGRINAVANPEKSAPQTVNNETGGKR